MWCQYELFSSILKVRTRTCTETMSAGVRTCSKRWSQQFRHECLYEYIYMCVRMCVCVCIIYSKHYIIIILMLLCTVFFVKPVYMCMHWNVSKSYIRLYKYVLYTCATHTLNYSMYVCIYTYTYIYTYIHVCVCLYVQALRFVPVPPHLSLQLRIRMPH